MVLSIPGILYAIIAALIISAQVVCHRWIKKVTNMYWFWLAVGLSYLIYFIAMSWVGHINEYIHFDFPKVGEISAKQSQIISKAFLLNICPFLNVALPICLIADPSRKAARGFAPLGILACGLVIFVDIPSSRFADWSWQYVFQGAIGAFDMYLMGHALNLFISIGVILNTPKFGWKGMVAAYGEFGLLLTYVGITKTITNCSCFTAGLSPNDFTEGNFNILLTIGIPLPWSQIIFFVGLILLIGGTILLYDFCKRNNYKYGNKPNRCWWQWYEYNKFKSVNFWGPNKNFALNQSGKLYS